MALRLIAVIPSYRVSRQIATVVEGALRHVDCVIVVDDRCPEGSGDVVERQFSAESRVIVIRHEENLGVGGAVVTGYKKALSLSADVVIKIDGDGQMDSDGIPALVYPILCGRADYAKGSRFYFLEHLRGMPPIRLLGNSILSFVNKVSSGYWDIMDPTNGFTALHCKVAAILPLDKLSRRYFFESDMLFRLSTVRAVVEDVYFPARYEDEHSSLNIWRTMRDFPPKYLAAFFKRFFYCYLLRDVNAGTIETLVGSILALFGLVFGSAYWARSIITGSATPLGTVMLAAISVILGFQLLLAALGYDVSNVPKNPIHLRLTGYHGRGS